jgi:hypothetical protein
VRCIKRGSGQVAFTWGAFANVAIYPYVAAHYAPQMINAVFIGSAITGLVAGNLGFAQVIPSLKHHTAQ